MVARLNYLNHCLLSRTDHMISRVGALLVFLAFSWTLLPAKEKVSFSKSPVGFEIKAPSTPLQPTSDKAFVKASDIAHAPVIQINLETLGLLICFLENRG